MVQHPKKWLVVRTPTKTSAGSFTGCEQPEVRGFDPQPCKPKSYSNRQVVRTELANITFDLLSPWSMFEVSQSPLPTS